LKYEWRNEWVFVVEQARGCDVIAAIESILSARTSSVTVERLRDRYYDSPNLDGLVGAKDSRKQQFRLRERSEAGSIAYERKTRKGLAARLKQAPVGGASEMPQWFEKHAADAGLVETLVSQFTRHSYATGGAQACSVTFDEAIQCNYPLFDASDVASSAYLLDVSILKFKLTGPLDAMCKRLIYDLQLTPEKSSLYREGIVAAAASASMPADASRRWSQALLHAGVRHA
jgi:hypothetical protein